MDLTSGYPLWPVVDGLVQTYPRLRGDTRADVAIIGGGITGALVAHHLADAGIDAILLDRRDIGWGSTSASTALLQYEIDVSLTDLIDLRGHDHATRAYRACSDAIDKLADLHATTGGGAHFERRESLYLASRKRDRTALESECHARRAIGFDVRVLEEDAIVERFGIRRPLALISKHGAQVDAYAFAHALLRQATSRGLRVFDRSDVTEVKARDTGVILRTADDVTVHARHLVFAAGYETNSFLKEQVAALISTYAFASEPASVPAPWNAERCLIWEHADPYLYLRTTHDGRVLVGGEDEEFRDPARRDALLPKKTRQLVERYQSLFPDAPPLEVAFSWAGTFGKTEDGLAYIGQHPRWPSTWFALGYGGNGITYSVLAAEIIRDSLRGIANPYADLFCFDR